MKKIPFVTVLLTAVSILLSAFLFVQLVELMVRIVKLYAGLRAFGGMLALIPLSILQLSFVIAVGPHYSKHARIGNLWGAFFRLNSILCFLFVLLEFVRFLVYRPVFISNKLPFYAFWTPLNYVNVLGGLVLGVAFAALALWFFSRYRTGEQKTGE